MQPVFSNPQFDDDLHLLMAIAVLGGQRGVDAETDAVYETWAQCYPRDALGGLGRGLSMIRHGDPMGGYELIEQTVKTAETRVDQAREVMDSLRRDLTALAS